jgi:pimeloyl-ACP methyl ester carboxylesterase
MEPDWAFVGLDDGRGLAYAEYGDPDGLPLIYCHGFPGSGREAMLVHTVALEEGARIIAPDRPGFGRSGFQRDRTILDWVADFTRLADELQLEQVGVLGVSGGAPYALACLAQIPERLGAGALICPLGPIYLKDVFAQMSWATKLNLSATHRSPLLSEAFFGPLTVGLLNWWPGMVDHLRSISAPAADRAELEDPQVRHIINQTIHDAMGAGARGARQDLSLYLQDWRIPITAIDTPIDLWHGKNDDMVPISHSHWYAAHLPNCQVNYLPDEGHFSLPMRYSANIIRSLLDRIDQDAI